MGHYYYLIQIHMYKNVINIFAGLSVIAIALIELSAAAELWVLTIAGAVVVISSLWELTVYPNQDTYHTSKQR